MFKNWLHIITTDCEVIKVSNSIAIYPIFKNGSTSLTLHAKNNNFKILKNHEISNLKKIVVYMRDPVDRFVSGIHTYLLLNNKKCTKQLLDAIENFEIYDRHFVPQYFWLLHLSKFYKDTIHIKPIEDLYKLIPERCTPFVNKRLSMKNKKRILSLDYKKYVSADTGIIKKYMGAEKNLITMLREFKNDMS